MPIKRFPDKQPEPEGQPGLIKRVYDRLHQKWEAEGRPSILEAKLIYAPIAIGGAIALGGFGIAVADEVLGTNIANDWANVKIEPDDNWFERSRDSLAQCIGITAGGETANECRAVSVILDINS